jgi:uncharacterized protein YidB (DUF937 family)
VPGTIEAVVTTGGHDGMSQPTGETKDELCGQVAKALPHLVDQATPNGQVPKQGTSAESLMGGLKK